MKKIEKNFFFSRDQVIPLVRKWREERLVIGFSSGAFDLLHHGHIDYLHKASRFCDRLVIGVNSDLSVRGYKGPKRPLVGERDRIRIVASLKSVSCVFLFNEPNNRENIIALKPKYYFKGGDYQIKDLSSAPYLKKWGGEVKTLPFIKNHSTSGLVDRILERYHDELPQALSFPKSKQREVAAVFLDRDGVINQEVEYLHNPKEFFLIPGALAGLKQFQELGYRLIIVTNQAGIGLGYFTKEDFFKVNKKMLSLCKKNKIVISRIYYCPHSLEDHCACRKPGTLLLERATHEVGIDLSRSIMVGDKTSDIVCGQALGLTTILVKTGHGGKDGEYPINPNAVVKDLREAARWSKKNLKINSQSLTRNQKYF